MVPLLACANVPTGTRTRVQRSGGVEDIRYPIETLDDVEPM